MLTMNARVNNLSQQHARTVRYKQSKTNSVHDLCTGVWRPAKSTIELIQTMKTDQGRTRC